MPQQPRSRSSFFAETFPFPWQGAVLILALTAGAVVHEHPTVLRPFVDRPEIAAAHLPAAAPLPVAPALR